MRIFCLPLGLATLLGAGVKCEDCGDDEVKAGTKGLGGGIETGVGGVVRSESGVILCSTCH